ncbi:uncharacterized protein LOC106152392 [Lingula anatina]|uniref:Uncharacterized protein LOC106152392 n=1 Tax=Lingula anatina TaxID=7574 RepID=A0A1S3H5X2_LINAN|nr:uncharacterized protein LOC106152392 [Lingula anatina]|eukprot:XP_013381398.1 uncharacterized protein LOC106152392 [Lingula anatina]
MNLHEFIYVIIFAFLLEGGNSLRKSFDNLNPVERGERADQKVDVDINAEKSCSRERSKIVRDIFQKQILPFYEDLSPDGQVLEVPRGCPFNQLRDIYGEQERHKTFEYPSRWVCEYCGKAFSSEYFLDLHFDNRHKEGVSQERDRTCLADYCDIFRCDIVSGARKLGYWDKALCKPSDWSPIYDKCEVSVGCSCHDNIL